MTGNIATTPLGTVLVVDDSEIIVETMRFALEQSFTVVAADSGEACLEYLAGGAPLPDLILLDIEMGGIDGFETCRRLRADHDLPVIFVSAHDDLPERIKAFDSGGDDFVVKPADPEVILRKAQRVVQHYSERNQLAAEKASLQTMAMDFLRNLGDSGILLSFMRDSLHVVDYEVLARRLLTATTEYGIHCCVQIRFPRGCHTLTPEGQASPLEVSVLEKSSTMGRIFQFSRRMVVNYDFVSILITDLPDDEVQVGKLRDNIAILAEGAEAMAETIKLRQDAAQRAAALQAASSETANAIAILRDLYRKQQSDTRMSLQQMIDGIESAYVYLGLSDQQEHQVSDKLRESVEDVLRLFDVGIEFDRRLTMILDALGQSEASSGRRVLQ